MGNPGVRLMVPSARVTDVRTMGEEGKHARFSLHSGSHRALGVAFGRSSLGVDDDEALDAAIRLEVNHWNGAVEPRVVLREVYPLDAATAGRRPAPVRVRRRRVVGALRGRARPRPHRSGRVLWRETVAIATARSPQSDRRGSPRRGGWSRASASSPTATIAELVSSGAAVLAVAADASRRAALANGATGLARFNGGAALIACHRCGADAVAGLAARGQGGLALVDYAALAMAPDLAASFEHVVLVDAPRSAADVDGRRALALAPVDAPPRPSPRPASSTRSSPTPSASSASASSAARRPRGRRSPASSGRSARGGQMSGPELRAALAGPGPHPLGSGGRGARLPRPA